MTWGVGLISVPAKKTGNYLCHLIYSLYSVNIYGARHNAGCQANSCAQIKHVGAGLLRLQPGGHTGHDTPPPSTLRPFYFSRDNSLGLTWMHVFEESLGLLAACL